MRSIGTIVFFVLPAALRADVEGSQQLVWDFTRPEAAQKVAQWTAPDQVRATSDGLGWDGAGNASMDVAVSSRAPVAVGWAWHPVTNVGIRAEVLPPGKFEFNSNSITYPSTAGELYARYSADGRHWSTWQALGLRPPSDKQQPRLFFTGTLSVPQQTRKRYEPLLREFAGTDRPVVVDEGRAAEWILKKEPKFFEREAPYIGYVEFLWETRIRGDQRVKKVAIELSYSRGGGVRVPGAADDSSPWKFKAPESNTK